MNKIKKIGVLGCGNMAGAMTFNLSKNLNKLGSTYQFHLYTPSKTKALKLCNDISKYVETEVHDSISFISEMDIVFLGFKPQQFKEVSNNLKKLINKKTIIYSILAGINIQTITDHLSNENIVRSMPNTPIKIGKGMNLLSFSSELSKENVSELTKLSKLMSPVEIVVESSLDLLTPVSGSGPAYLFYLGESLVSYLVKNNIEKNIAENIVKETLAGAASLWADQTDTSQTKISATELKNQVTSKGGITQEVLNGFDHKNLSELIHQSLDLGVTKSIELGKL